MKKLITGIALVIASGASMSQQLYPPTCYIEWTPLDLAGVTYELGISEAGGEEQITEAAGTEISCKTAGVISGVYTMRVRAAYFDSKGPWSDSITERVGILVAPTLLKLKLK